MAVTSEQLVIIGAGPAGCACAIEAARLGLRVLLVDEHPQTPAAMSLDAPYFYGARLAPALSDASAMADAVLGSNEPLMECLEAGVEVLPNTCVWGVFRPDVGNPATRGRQIGLADEERSWIVNYDYLVLASGARDLVLSFPGWQLPGVLGAKAALALIERYQALGGGSMTILGSGNLGLQVARRALEAGIGVAAVVDPSDRILGDVALAEELRGRGVPFHLSHTIQSAQGVQAVEAARLVPVGPDGVTAAATTDIPCDTICMAYGVVPNVELASVAGCEIEFNACGGGWAPRLDGSMRSSNERIYAVGDAACVLEAALLDSGIAEEQGRAAARAIATAEGLAPAVTDAAPLPRDALYPPLRWLDSLVQAGGMEVMLCQCEEVSRRAFLEVAPPSYLETGDAAPAGGLQSLSERGRASQDLFKRLTRVGMGHCQGRRCRDHGAMLIAREAGIDIGAVVPGSYRVPVRPLPLSVLWADDETDEERANWTTWLHEVDDPIPKAKG